MTAFLYLRCRLAGRTLTLFWAGCCAVALASSSQEPVASFTTDSNLVLIDVTVRDRSNRLMSGLRRDDFEVLEDGKPQPLRYASEGELPLAIALVVDISGSMHPTFTRLRDSAIEALGALHPEDRVAVIAFNSRSYKLADLTSKHDKIEHAVSIMHAGGGTDILGAIYAASVYLKRAAPKDRRAIILVSDNLAGKSAKHSEHLVEDTALEFETDIHSIQVRGHSMNQMLTLAMLNRVNVDKLAEATGGEVLKSDVENVGTSFRSTLERIRHRYTLGYYIATDSEHPSGSYHKLQVRLTKQHGNANADYYVSARRGYFTAKP